MSNQEITSLVISIRNFSDKLIQSQMYSLLTFHFVIEFDVRNKR